MSFKTFLICSSGGSHIRRAKTFCVIVVEGIFGNMHMKSFGMWRSWRLKKTFMDDGRETMTDYNSSY